MAQLKTTRILAFWLVLCGFFVWDWLYSAPVNLRLEPAIFALGSGQAPTGGHCASFGK